MSYTALDDIREMTGIEKDEVSDIVLGTLRDRAEQKLIKDITIKFNQQSMNPDLDGNKLNGSNKTFYTKESPIADVDRNSSIDGDDITVEVWGDAADESTKSEYKVSSVESESGRVTLSSAPSANDEVITATYSVYLAEEVPSWKMLKTASVYMAGYLSVIKFRGKEPAKYKIGDFTYDDESPGRVFKREYISTLNEITDRTSVG